MDPSRNNRSRPPPSNRPTLESTRGQSSFNTKPSSGYSSSSFHSSQQQHPSFHSSKPHQNRSHSSHHQQQSQSQHHQQQQPSYDQHGMKKKSSSNEFILDLDKEFNSTDSFDNQHPYALATKMMKDELSNPDSDHDSIDGSNQEPMSHTNTQGQRDHKQHQQQSQSQHSRNKQMIQQNAKQWQNTVENNPNGNNNPKTIKTKLQHPRQAFVTIEDGFRAIERGNESLSAARYQEACSFYMDGSEILTHAAEMETSSPLVKDLIIHKAYEVLSWSDKISMFLQRQTVSTVGSQDAQFFENHKHGQTLAISIDEQHVLSSNENSRNYVNEDCMYYTPVTSKDPRNFTKDGYQLLCVKQRRKPSLLIVITMYNENAQELSMTLRKCCNNIQYLMECSLPGYEGNEAWQNILVCIVSDGRTKANISTLNYLASIKCFEENAMRIGSVGVDVQLHLFEKLVHLSKDSKSKKTNKTFPPLQLVFGLKEYNSGKLSSHLWYFNAMAEQINPEYTGLLDVGTMPTKSAFYRLLSAMEINEQIGGVCGEIAVDRPIPNLLNFVVAAQHYEYKVSNILDKAMESCFGYISVLPGAFSAYRYAAIRGAPLQAYFKSLTSSMEELGPFQGNMYLAEDRILAFEILAKKDRKWTMHYVKDAIARTDVPTNLTALIGQRRRWLNGSFFAMLFGIMQWYRIYTESGHSLLRKIFFTIQYLYMIINTMLNWFLPAAFYLAIYYVIIAGFADNQWGFVDLSDISQHQKDFFSFVINAIYGFMMLMLLIYGIGNKPKHIERTYTVISVFMGIIIFITFVVAILIFCSTDRFTAFQVGFASAILGVYFVASALHCEIHHIFFAFLQYSILLPTFVNVLGIYSFCNLHDLSWGTKGIDSGGHGDSKSKKSIQGTYEDVVAKQKAEEEQKKKEVERADLLKKRFDSFRSNLLLFWLFCNISLTGGCIYAVSADQFLPILYVVVGFFNVFRFIGSCCYLLYILRQKLLFCCELHTGILKEKHRKKVGSRRRGTKESTQESSDDVPDVVIDTHGKPQSVYTKVQ